MKNILKITAAFALSLLAFGCTQEEFAEITEVSLSRCLEPQNLAMKVDVATGDYVTFEWDVNKDADAYNLVIATDENFSSTVKDIAVNPDEVPYTIRLTADQEYWFKVRAYQLEETDAETGEAAIKESSYSNWAVYDGSQKTYAVKDNLFLEVTARTDASVSFTWSTELSDYQEVTKIVATPVKGGDKITHELTSEEISAAAATVDGLASSSEYQFVLYYMSASRGAVDAWTKPAAGSLTTVSTAADLTANVAAGGDIYLTQSGSPYEVGSLKPAGSVKIIGELGDDGSMPVIVGKIELTAALVESGATFYFENVQFDGGAANSRVLEHTGGELDVKSAQFVNCVVTNYLGGLFYDNNDAVLKLGELLFDTCTIYNIAGSGGDCVDIRKTCEITTIKFVNNTIYDGMRTFFRFDAKETIKIGEVDFENNTVKGVAVINDSNNQGLFAFKVATNLTLKKNLFLYEDGGVTDEATVDKCQLVRDNSAIVVPTITASDNYSFAEGKDFFLKVKAADAGCTILEADPCYNSKGNFFQLENQDLISAKVGASKWWISYVEKEEDLTQNVITGAHTWNLQDATLFAGEVKNSRVRDELMLVGTEATPMNADGGINFLSGSVLTKKGVPTEGYASFKVNTAGSVDLEVADGGSSSVVIALFDDNGLAVQGGAMASSGAGVQKVLVPSVAGEGTIYVYTTGAISLTKLAWSLDTKGGNKVLATPKPTAEPVTLTEGDATAVTFTWEAVDNAASYQVIFNKRSQDPQTELSFTVAAEDIAALKAGLYNFTVQALPADDDIYYVASEKGAASIAIQPKGGAEETVDVTLTWDFSSADWQATLSASGLAENTSAPEATGWSFSYDGLSYQTKKSCKWSSSGYIQTGGKGSTTDRVFSFTAPAAGTLKVIASNTKSEDPSTRAVTVTVGEETQNSECVFTSTAQIEVSFDIAAGEVKLYPTGNGLRFYKIEFTYKEATDSAKETHDWNFSAADWQETLGASGLAENTSAPEATGWSFSYDGLSYQTKKSCKWSSSGYIQTGGKGSTTDRVFSFTVGKAGTLKVLASNTKSEDPSTRAVTVTVGEETQNSECVFTSTAQIEVSFDIAAGEVKLYPTGNGLRFYRISFESK